MTTRIKTNITSSLSALSAFEATAEERAILAIPSLRGWFDAGEGIERESGFRWRDRISSRRATVLDTISPLVISGSNGRPALQMGYGSENFTGMERGALRTSSHYNLIGANGFTVISVTRVPTVASGESATLGGNVWSSRGPAAATTPGLNISGSTGRPTFRAGGATISNPGAFDARTGNWHVIRCMHNVSASSISIAIDRVRAVGSAAGAAVAPDSSIVNMLSPLIGCFLNSAGNAVATPFYGQMAAVLFFDAVLSAPQLAAVEGYLASKFGVTLV